ncbi:MAG: Xaa-Pro peptidase family protein [Desulfobacterales bacterium]|nr:Xaa-Pro peptidase family protein [Desulfobacterales bacterium]
MEVEPILQKKSVEGILFFSPENIRYLTGFSGSEGYLLVGKDEMLLLVDSRYITQARKETRECRVSLVDKGLKGVAKQASSLGLRRLGFEAQGISVARFEQLQKGMEKVELVPIRDELERLRGSKTGEEIAWITKAIRIAEEAWEEALDLVTPGAQEADLALELEYRMKKKGAEGIAFDTIVASGPQAALPHAQPTPRPLEQGDLLLFDFGCRYRGYCSDESCTIIVGRATEEQRRIYGIVKDAHDKAIAQVKPGVRLAAIDAAAREHIDHAGHGEHFGHGTGHGVGLGVHEWPVVGKDSQDVAEEGMVFTIEPGIYIPGWGGVRIEDMVVVTADGCEVLTAIPKDLMVV